MGKKIILATTSPHRKVAFEMLGIPFETVGSDVEEYYDGRPDRPDELVSHLAKLKAEAVAAKRTDGIVIGFDSVGWFDGEVMEKPRSREEALGRLRALSGNRYQFYTGIHVIDFPARGGRRAISEVVMSDIVMRGLTDSEICKYLDQDPGFNTQAQGYDPLKTYGATFIREVHGSYNNPLRGIPLEVVVEMLKKVGYQI